MKAPIIAAVAVNGREWVQNQTDRGRIIAAPSEPADTYRVTPKSKINVPRAIRQAKGDSTMKQPAAVATPFPPALNPVNTG